MPICTKHGHFERGNFCPECGRPLQPDAPDDTVNIRSPHASFTNVVMPAAAPAGEALVKCPRCGQRNKELDTFDCMGPCGRQHLCKRHFDAELEVCIECVPARKVEEARKAEEARRNTKPAWKRIGIELVTIPAGNFLYGDNKARVYLEEYSIGKTPVTNAQYKAFVDATGHRAPEHWERGRIPPQKEKHPVVNVSWKDAQAFCEWAGLRLPSEQEWEKAARGTDGRTYPWGEQAPTDDLCNFNNNVGTTTPVGQYPKGASPYGLLDMAGNVWEWCADWYEVNKYRVLRGGAYGNNAGGMRCAYRHGAAPDLRNLNLGFRVGSPGL